MKSFIWLLFNIEVKEIKEKLFIQLICDYNIINDKKLKHSVKGKNLINKRGWINE